MAVAAASVPVTMGSPAFRSLALDGFDVVEAWFAPGDELPRHTHDRACVAVMLAGSFDLRIESHCHHCPPTTVFTEPAGETHSNDIGCEGARVVVIQPDPGRPELLRPFARFLDRTSTGTTPGSPNRPHDSPPSSIAETISPRSRPKASSWRCWSAWRG